MSPSKKTLVQIALPLGARQLFTYAVPRELREVLRPGHRVRVPFGRRSACGYVVGFTAEPPPGKLRAVTALEPEEVLFTPEILALADWAARYYLAPLGQFLEAALPPSARRGTRKRAVADQAAGAAGNEAAGAGESSAGTEPAREATRPFQLHPEQVRAAEEIGAALDVGKFATFLLHGVTGSGKTEVYLEAAEKVVRAGGGVLFLVPEIALGTQILDRVQRRFAGQVGLFHSQTGDARRLQVWRAARTTFSAASR